MQELRRTLGLRNILFVVGTLALYPLGSLLLASQLHDPQGAMGAGGGLMALWFLAALLFFVANVVWLVVDIRKGRPAHKSVLALALPFLGLFLAVAIIR